MNEDRLKIIGLLYDLLAKRHRNVQRGVVHRLLLAKDGVTREEAEPIVDSLYRAHLVGAYYADPKTLRVGCGKYFSIDVARSEKSAPLRDMLLRVFAQVVIDEDRRNPLTAKQIASVEREMLMIKLCGDAFYAPSWETAAIQDKEPK